MRSSSLHLKIYKLIILSSQVDTRPSTLAGFNLNSGCFPWGVEATHLIYSISDKHCHFTNWYMCVPHNDKMYK